MSLTSLTVDTITVDGDVWSELEALPSLDDWLRVICGVRPGVSSPRCTPVAVHPSCIAQAGWLQALWGLAV